MLHFVCVACLLLVLVSPSSSSAGTKQVQIQHKSANISQSVKSIKKQKSAKHRKGSAKTSALARKKAHPQRIRFSKQVKDLPGVYFVDDMESGANGWTVETHADTMWHLTTYDAVSPTHSWWCGVESTATYETGNPIDQSLISPSIDLSGATAPINLMFNENFTTQSMQDFCWIGVSTDSGATWTELRSDSSGRSGTSYGWITTNLYLSAYAGQVIKIRFHFSSTTIETTSGYPGWFIDNVMVYGQGGTVNGMAYFDINRNGVYDSLDSPMQYWDIAATGLFGTVYTSTDDSGKYSFYLPPGSYTIEDTDDFGQTWAAVSPAFGRRQITFTSPGQIIDSVDFGNWHPYIHISGFMFDDTNHNAIYDSGETLLRGHLIDMDGPVTSQYQYTDSSGHFSFIATDFGTYDIYQDDIGDAIQTVPSTDYYVQVTDTLKDITNLIFGNYYGDWGNRIRISGFVFSDKNYNGIYDSGDVPMQDQHIQLYYTYANRRGYYDDQFTDSSGKYTFVVENTGSYEIYQDGDGRGWVQTLPPDGDDYSIEVDDLFTNITGIDFGNFYAPARSCSIAGWIFDDLNKNGVKDSGETGISGATLFLVSDSDDEDTSSTRSDSTGHYIFDRLDPDGYTLLLQRSIFWTPISKLNKYYSLPFNGITIDNANFGVYMPVRNASISGRCFNDLNKNGVEDPGELGVSGWTIRLASSYNGYYYERDVPVDSNGNYSVDSLWPGAFVLTQELRPNWVQSLPDNFKPLIVALDSAQHFTSADFGDYHDGTFNLGFRSFVAESLALGKSYDGKSYGKAVNKIYIAQVAISAIFSNNPADASGLVVTFDNPISLGLSVTPPADQYYDATRKTLTLSFQNTLPAHGSVAYGGIGTYLKPVTSVKFNIKKADWIFTDPLPRVSTHVTKPYVLYVSVFRNVEPNGIDLLMAMQPKGMLIGTSRDAVSSYTISFRTYKDIVSSLVPNHGQTQTGTPECLCTGASAVSFKKQLHILPPNKYSNRLFAEAVALKTSIAASDSNITTIGFGDLIFDEGGENPLNGKPVRAIADVVNQYMSSAAAFGYCQMPGGYEWLDSMSLYQTIRKIDSAFCGPMGYTSWTPGTHPHLTLTQVRSVLDIPYLHIDSTNPGSPLKPQVALSTTPRRFELAQNYPNPFNPTTTISFSLPHEAKVTLKIYNLLGQEVATLLNREDMDEGDQEIDFDASHLSSGVYFYRISVEGIADDNGVTGQSFIAVKKMMLVK